MGNKHSVIYKVYSSKCFGLFWEIVRIKKKSPHASAFLKRSDLGGGRATHREPPGGHLTYLVIVCSLAPGQRRQKGGVSWLCSQNNRGNGETGTEPQGSSRQ